MDWLDGYFENKPVLESTLDVAGVISLTDVWNAGGVRWDGTDLIDENETIISNVLQAATIAALPAASTKAGKFYAVDNPGNNTKGLPAVVYSLSSKWQFTGGDALIAEDCSATKVTSPAATFTSATATSINGGTDIRLTSAGAHGLTSAGAVGSKIYVSAGTNWTPGLYTIKTIAVDTSGLVIDLEESFVSGMGTPTIALAGSPFVIERIKLPPLSDTGKSLLRAVIDYTHAATDAITVTVELVASGGAPGSGFSVYTPAAQTTNAPIIHFNTGFFNFGATNVQHSLFAISDDDGMGTLNGGAIATTGAVQTNVTTDLILTGQVTLAGDSVKIQNFSARVTL